MKEILFNDDNDSLILYKVRKQIMEFILAFVEEKNTPKTIINLLCNIFTPRLICDCIINTLKKLYLKNKQGLDEKEFSKIKFDEKVCSFFEEIYFKVIEFSKKPEFELANRMFQFIKMLSAVHEKKEAHIVLESAKNESEQNEIKKINEEKLQLRFLNKFFEKIIRSVPIQVDGVVALTLFTIHPLIQYLTPGTREQFYKELNRENVYTKILAMMEYSSYFYEEIKYNFQKSENNLVLRYLNKIDYFLIELILFVVTIVINMIILLSYNGNVKLESNIQSNIDILSWISLILNTLTVFVWIYSKYPLYQIIENQKYRIKVKLKRDLNHQELTMIDKFNINVINSLLMKTEIIFFFFNILMNTIGLLEERFNFVYSLQMLGIINLSETLKNIMRAISYRSKQFSSVFLYLLIIIFIFAFFHFLFFNDLLTKTIDDKTENLCQSLLYCFLTMINLGLRTDGGIGNHISALSYNVNKSEYFKTFIFIFSFFIAVNVIVVEMMLGIIFDTFGEFREKAKKIEDDMLNVCLICEKRRETLEKEGINFNKHVKQEHDTDKYFEYLIGLKFVNAQETNAINSYVINMVKDRQISWVPSKISSENISNTMEKKGVKTWK